MDVTNTRSRTTTIFLALALGLGLASSDAHATGGDTGGGGGDYSSAWFITPLPNESFEGAPVTIDVEIRVNQGIDAYIDVIELFVDGASVGSQSCPTGCVFTDVELGKGEHDLELMTDTGYATSTVVYVDTAGPNGRGCECSVNAEHPWLWSLLAIPGLLLLASGRRREPE